jgi:hypothetical protein
VEIRMVVITTKREEEAAATVDIIIKMEVEEDITIKMGNILTIKKEVPFFPIVLYIDNMISIL